jgi:hypothetical protein
MLACALAYGVIECELFWQLNFGGHLSKLIVPLCQSIEGLCVWIQSYPKNILWLPSLVMAKFILSWWSFPVTSIITSKQSVTLPSLFSVPSAFLTNRGYSSGVVVSPFSWTKSLSIAEWVHPESIRAVIMNSFLESKVINLTLTSSSHCSFLYRFSSGFLSFFFFLSFLSFW